MLYKKKLTRALVNRCSYLAGFTKGSGPKGPREENFRTRHCIGIGVVDAHGGMANRDCTTPLLLARDGNPVWVPRKEPFELLTTSVPL
uniref:HDC04661 n=1 Tax=Drosophila melanogaster TaxID=7227 RepID=Q6IGX0_DROME|nr:TPA_inf: HDC04661 [Drosophila melanogaster]